MNEKLFDALFSRCKQGYLTLWRLPDKRTFWYKAQDYKTAYADALKMSAEFNVFFGLGLRRKKLPDGKRGADADVMTVTTLYADIDVKGPAHAETALPETRGDAEAFLNALPLRPSAVIWSGNGIHAYWFLDAPFVISGKEEQDHISGISQGFAQLIAAEGKKRGWKLDNVSDLSRALRVPGSINHKLETGDRLSGSAKCEAVSFEGTRYGLEAFLPYKAERRAPAADREHVEAAVIGEATRIMEKCAFMRHCKDNAADLPEPYWHVMITNVSLAKGGAELAHEISRPYPKYRKTETDEKIARAVKENKPHTCGYIREKLGFICPEDCEVKAPVVHSILTKAEQMESLIAEEKLDMDRVFSPDVLSLLYYARNNLPAEYSRFKLKLKNKVSLRDFERAVLAQGRERGTVEDTDMPLELRGLNLGNAVQPSGWNITMEYGIQKMIQNKVGNALVTVCPTPIVITRRLENIDDDSEKIELAFFRNNRWKSVLATRSQVFSKSAVIRLADSGLPISSESSGEVVKYLCAYENANIQAIPYMRSVGRIGWLKNEFFPFVTDKPIVFESEYKEAGDLCHSLTARGDFELWCKTAEELRQNPFARFLMAASFASPLLEPLGHRVFFIHVWHDSKSGKTAAIKYAISAWGNPQRLLGSFNATAVGLERMAGTLKHLPLAVDELQVLNDKRMSLENVVYSLGNGFGRMRGAKDGGIQETVSWRSVIITSGEQPMSSDSSNDGITTRVLELYGKPAPDEAFAHDLHQISESNYGHAGPVYIRYITENITSRDGKARRDFDRMLGAITKLCEGGIPGGHADNVAAVCLGDYYASLAIFSREESRAWDEAAALGAEIIANNRMLEKEDTVARAWEYLVQWVAINKGRFEKDAVPCYGEIKGTKVYINANVMRDALREGGFDYSKVTRGLKERGHFITGSKADGSRMQIQYRLNGIKTRCFCISVDMENPGVEPLTSE